MRTEMESKTKVIRYLALTGNLGLLVWVVLWQYTLSPHEQFNPSTLAIVWAIPLLFPLPGILIGKPYTHAWANFVLMLYYLHGFTILYISPDERWLAGIELLLTTTAFISNILYTRFRGRELGLKLTRLSVVEKQERAKFEQE
ncbi:DUF2069 domain-containing protein [Vibrio maerlii]|uniref:DUF2069 domain-containing protein n=1 Tax=Vibrio maerlii TaxID=2231648 RepID=UPI000E3BBE8C|nr:DUF2069 domain-containing protein [Vibrio maerlii]